MNKQLHGFNIIRLLCFCALTTYHVYWVLSSSVFNLPDNYPNLFIWLIEHYARSMCFSGFGIVVLSSFLLGRSKKSLRERRGLFIFLGLGWTLFSVLLSLRDQTEFHLAWDVYPLFLLGISSAYLIFRNTCGVFPLCALTCSLMLLFFPIWDLSLFRRLPYYVQEVLIGRCPEDYADWPILPWISLIWLGFWWGRLYRDRGLLSRFYPYELVLWLPGLLLFFQHKEAYYYTPIGEGWACHTFRQPPIAFLGHLSLWLLAIRLSCHEKVQSFLDKNRVVRMIGTLALSRYFFIAYLLHYLILFSLEGFYRYYHINSLTSWTIAPIIVPLGAEITTRLLVRIWPLKRRHGES
ncbi:MAG: hypothetical protein KA436_00395 [Oligoflexales bacterium]|nr:hypothetical protein [Oligoflexales bacterium]